ncbi:MAG: hypothetical protein ACREON_08260 [Gemmatimonadaceae bacterium]
MEGDIRRILLESWDPLGVRDVPAEHCRYECFVQDLTLLLIGGGSNEDVEELLRAGEIDRLGLGHADDARVSRVARALRALAGGAGSSSADRSAASG